MIDDEPTDRIEPEAETLAILEKHLSKFMARKRAATCEAQTARDVILKYETAEREGLLTKPEAIAWRFEYGQWPHDRVETAAELRAAKGATDRRIAT